MGYRILVDTNILLDYVLCREPYSQAARSIIIACKQRLVSGCIAAHSITNMFFILRKVFSAEERRSLLQSLCELFEVESIDKTKVLEALADEEFSDFEDCLQMKCAVNFRADYIVTRNRDDFKGSSIPCIEPDELVQLLGLH